MRIYSFSKIIALPFVILFAGILYYILEVDDTYWWTSIIPLVILVAIYTLHPQIDYWYHTKKPVPLDEELLVWLRKYSPYYNKLKDSDKEKYETRMSLYLEARAFTSIGEEKRKVPEDVKCAIASQGIMMNMGNEDFLIGDMDRVFLYKHPFPSPRMQFLHTVETFYEDGTLIFSLSHLIPGLIHSDQYYNIVMHGYAEAYLQVYDKGYPIIADQTWEGLEAINGFKRGDIEATLGYKIDDIRIVHINYFFTYPEKYQETFNSYFDLWCKIFNQNPLNGEIF